MTKLRAILFALVATCGAGIIAKPASAQVYPSRPITIIVPVPPGGVADPIARILADHMSAQLGQPIVIENVTGAGGSIGVARAARAAPDGYTLSIGNWLSHVGASAVYPVQYDVLKDFAPVSLLTESPVVVIARSSFPANDLKEMLDDLLSPERLRRRGLFRPEAVARYITEHRRGRADWSMQIWQFLTLELWMQTFLDGGGAQQFEPEVSIPQQAATA